MERIIKKFKTAQELALELAKKLKEVIEKKSIMNGKYFLSLSGGSTPKLLFGILADFPFSNEIKWDNVHLFWGDERCVPPDDVESNYGMTNNLLLDKITIPPENIHRVKGEAKPEEEASRYAEEIKNRVLIAKSLPRFDCILLGMGEDGHTASLFPGKELNAVSQNICGVAEKTISNGDGENIQKRISLTRDVICNGENIFFLVTGDKKAKTLSGIIKETPESNKYPASGIHNINGISEWWIDENAALYI
ncbi:MAG: 6-phosphogluconolactonase [Ignavibacteriaceae bacterium]